jgi:uncharacterized protein YbaR (Trm112 family)
MEPYIELDDTDEDGFKVELWTVRVADLEKLYNPMRNDPWACGEIDEFDVLSCMGNDSSAGRLPAGLTTEDTISLEYNIARIAWLANNGWDDKDEPITVEMYSDSSNRWYPVVDGNHRLAAAIVLNMETIRITPDGDIDYMAKTLKPSLIEYV